MSNTLHVCGLFEWGLVEKGLMKVGRCRDCIHYEGFKEKDGKRKRLKEEKTDCPDWVIDTR